MHEKLFDWQWMYRYLLTRIYRTCLSLYVLGGCIVRLGSICTTPRFRRFRLQHRSKTRRGLSVNPFHIFQSLVQHLTSNKQY
jgi:hypothetical protein